MVVSHDLDLESAWGSTWCKALYCLDRMWQQHDSVEREDMVVWSVHCSCRATASGQCKMGGQDGVVRAGWLGTSFEHHKTYVGTAVGDQYADDVRPV